MSASGSIHVILVGNYEYDRQESMQRYADMLAAGLPALGVEVELLKPTPRLGRLKGFVGGLGKWLGYMDKFLLFPFDLRRAVKRARALHRRTVVHICDHSNAMYVRHLAGVPQVVTCHDLLAVRSALGHFPQNPIGWTGRRLQRWILSGLRHAGSIVCDSNATRLDLLSLGGDEALVRTLYIGTSYPYSPQTEEAVKTALAGVPAAKDLAEGGYIIHVGGNQWYKNREGVLRIYFDYIRRGGRLPLAMVGRVFTPAMETMLAQAPAGAKVIRVGNVSNAVLNALYSRAGCLLFPSLQEGFGWPVLEAMASGCCVVCSHRASLPEVGGEAAVYIDPDDEAEAARRLSSVLAESAGGRESRIKAGLAQAAQFDTTTMLRELVSHYEKQLMDAKN